MTGQNQTNQPRGPRGKRGSKRTILRFYCLSPFSPYFISRFCSFIFSNNISLTIRYLPNFEFLTINTMRCLPKVLFVMRFSTRMRTVWPRWGVCACISQSGIVTIPLRNKQKSHGCFIGITFLTVIDKAERTFALRLPARSASVDFRMQSLTSPEDALDSHGTPAAFTHSGSGIAEYSKLEQHENRYCCYGCRERSYYDWQHDSSLNCCSTNRHAAPGLVASPVFSLSQTRANRKPVRATRALRRCITTHRAATSIRGPQAWLIACPLPVPFTNSAPPPPDSSDWFSRGAISFYLPAHVSCFNLKIPCGWLRRLIRPREF